MYADQTAVLGPLSRTSEPHAYDLCGEHAARLTAPRGWELIRVEGEADASDELVALADALRPRPDRTAAAPPAAAPATAPSAAGERASRARSGAHALEDGEPAPRHLHLLRSPGHE